MKGITAWDRVLTLVLGLHASQLADDVSEAGLYVFEERRVELPKNLIRSLCT